VNSNSHTANFFFLQKKFTIERFVIDKKITNKSA
jgi:hypothetical protein